METTESWMSQKDPVNHSIDVFCTKSRSKLPVETIRFDLQAAVPVFKSTESGSQGRT